MPPQELGEISLPTQQKSDRVIEAHLNEWVIGSAVDETIARLAIESLTAAELNERIRPQTPIQTGGWWVRGVNWRTGEPMGNRFGQGKPDKPHPVKDGKLAKYLTAAGVEPDALFLPMPDKNYWLNVYTDKTLPRIWTEGAKKAGAGLTIGLPTIPLTGVWNWGKDKQLASDVRKWAQSGTRHIICFDSDYQDKPECRAAITKFVELLRTEGVASVKIASWDKEWKGMDDFIVANGGDAFKEVVAKAQTIKQWEKQFPQPSQTKQKSKPPQPSQICKEIAEKYREKLAWNIQVREWFLYERKLDGVWSKSPKEAIERVIKTEMEAINPDGFTYRTLTDVINLLKGDLMVEEWDSTKGLIPLQNGVFDKATKKLLPHSPGYRLTYCLPFDYDPSANCEPILEWLRDTVGGKEDLVIFLLAYLNAVINRRADLQRYLELIGPGGTGKSTYMKLASSLVGKKNTHTTKHQLLEESRFETANLFNKSLALVTEADQYVGAVNVLKAITGQDELHYEEKMKQAGEGFQFEGMVITAGNEPSRSADYTSGLARRKIAVWFRNHIPSPKRRDLDSEFKAYLPGLLNKILSFSDAEVTRLIGNAEAVCPALREFQRETLCETNPIADWLDNEVVRSPNSRLTPAFLYAKHKEFCDKTGQKPVSLKRFSNLLIDLCQVQLGWHDVKKGRDRLGRFITGLSIRIDGSPDPYPITEFWQSDSVTDEVTDVTDSVTAETTAVYGCDGCDAFLEDTTHTEIFAQEKNEFFPVNQLENGVLSVTPVTPVTPDDELQGWEAYSQKTPYPNPKSDNVRSSQKRALAIREAYRASQTKEDLSALQRENGGAFSKDELLWVYNWLKKFFKAEYNDVQATAKISQPELL
jgi:putative DNA primase/helicase